MDLLLLKKEWQTQVENKVGKKEVLVETQTTDHHKGNQIEILVENKKREAEDQMSLLPILRRDLINLIQKEMDKERITETRLQTETLNQTQEEILLQQEVVHNVKG